MSDMLSSSWRLLLPRAQKLQLTLSLVWSMQCMCKRGPGWTSSRAPKQPWPAVTWGCWPGHGCRVGSWAPGY